MQKLKVSKKSIRDNEYRIMGVGYCEMQFLLRYQNAIAYSSGVYGWSCDYYEVNGVVISTGYSYVRDKNMDSDYKLVKYYNELARTVQDNLHLSYEERVNETNALLLALVKKCEVGV